MTLQARRFFKDYHKGDIIALLSVLKRNKPKVAVDPTNRKFQESLEKHFEESMVILKPLKIKIEATDALIDQIVYRLYGLSEAKSVSLKNPTKLLRHANRNLVRPYRNLIHQPFRPKQIGHPNFHIPGNHEDQFHAKAGEGFSIFSLFRICRRLSPPSIKRAPSHGCRGSCRVKTFIIGDPFPFYSCLFLYNPFELSP
jgi:hypothetical protein